MATIISNSTLEVMTRPVILVTAFEPFGGEKINPTEKILEKLPDVIGRFEVRKLLLPVEYVRAQELAISEYDRVSPDAVIMLGQAGRRNAITPEMTARNVMNGQNPDNAGFKPNRVPVVEGGSDFLHSTLPIDAIQRSIGAIGIPCEISEDAGEYVCNALFYGMLHHNHGNVPTGFIHVPYIREQEHEDAPFMELEEIYKGILIAINELC